MPDLDRKAKLAEISEDIRKVNDEIAHTYGSLNAIAVETVDGLFKTAGVKASATDVIHAYATMLHGYREHRSALIPHARFLEGVRERLYPKDFSQVPARPAPKAEAPAPVAPAPVQPSLSEKILDTMPRLADMANLSPTQANNAQALYSAAMRTWQESQKTITPEVYAQGQSEQIAYLENRIKELEGGNSADATDNTGADHTDHGDHDDAGSVASTDNGSEGGNTGAANGGITREEVNALIASRDARILALTEELIAKSGDALREEMRKMDAATRDFFAGQIDTLRSDVQYVGSQVAGLQGWMEDNLKYRPTETATATEEPTVAGTAWYKTRIFFWSVAGAVIVAIAFAIVHFVRRKDAEVLPSPA